MKVLLWVPFFIFPVLVQSNFILTIFIFSFILAIAAVSFNLIFGFTGQLSMFHAAAFGIAAYITSLTVSIFHVPFWAGLLPAICFTIVISLVILNWNSVTNGTLGLMVLEKPFVWVPAAGLVKIDGPLCWYFFSLAALILTVAVFWLVLRSWIGRCFAAIRLNED